MLSPHTHTKGNFMEMKVLTNLLLVIILQYMHVSNHHMYPFNLHMLHINNILIKLEGENIHVESKCGGKRYKYINETIEIPEYIHTMDYWQRYRGNWMRQDSLFQQWCLNNWIFICKKKRKRKKRKFDPYLTPHIKFNSNHRPKCDI